ncbi:MAG: 50S ribosomal protein L35 [gamma proteobacterium symbiont of Bathyaustriella thionipta]|nr:50S ribosomal protein L35 [gamma proteobacterium symbiont of Bathyaustriella thionipta]MCU7949329.1 50S ribosomal protein L35 [gamma proteobacterium symbiont of Bathyaustriella thionipta]MCU7954915.1 50S ribosomal protein L35 [gamma proteobacterium symbiont of Bathyaustriella thionipta]MCU7955918.1 50S ribosomal protein L35 [gamma proteobacterium symbiont of Bathyaustriella thionipta]MCU7968192.1 50S ribosomal protein L35 [gamma proteobacterium symbiont of Bathyaustriella thionipta]
MPKMKSKRGASKRFRVTGSGRIKRGNANRSHILTKMTTKRKRHLRAPDSIDKSDALAIKRMLRLV